MIQISAAVTGGAYHQFLGSSPGVQMRNLGTGVKTRKVRRLVIEKDRCGDWRIRLYFDKGRCKLLGATYDTHNAACLAASGIPIKQNWFPLISASQNHA